MVTHVTAHARRILTSIVAALAMVCGSVVAAQPAQATTFSSDQLYSMTRSIWSLMNSERKSMGIGPLWTDSRLTLSAHRHNLKMAAANTMSHQLPGESSLGTRITATGYSWRACAENIGWNSDLSLNGVLYLQKVMFGERAPNDGHRLNILNSTYRNIGIDVYYDSVHHKLWLTEDFGRRSGT